MGKRREDKTGPLSPEETGNSCIGSGRAEQKSRSLKQEKIAREFVFFDW